VRRATAAAAVLGLSTTFSNLDAQNRLIDLDPFDRILLDEANENRELEVAPLDLHERKVPDPLPRSGTLRVRLVDRPLEEFDVRWMNIVGIDLFEGLVLEEARQLAKEGRFKEAHEDLTYLSRVHPRVPGLEQTTDDILESEATWAFQHGSHERAWMVLTALYERRPDRAGIDRALESIADRLLQSHVSANRFHSARQFVDVLDSRFGPAGRSVAARWQAKLSELAAERLDAARVEFASGNIGGARLAVEGALDVAPDLAAAQTLAKEIAAARPRVVVAVLAEAPQRLTRRMDDWASRRIETLVDPPLVELSGFGAEGGEYRSAYGELVHDGDGTATSLTFTTTAPDDPSRTYDVARQLLTATTRLAVAARPQSDMGSAGSKDLLLERLAEIAVDGTQTLKLTWRRPHVRPEALLAIGISDTNELTAQSETAHENSVSRQSAGSFGVKSRERGELVLVRKGDVARFSRTTPVEVVERRFYSDDEAVEALERGDVDIVERVAASHATRLANRDDIVVGQYALPTVHVLVTSASAPLLQVPELRRAVLYGIDRQGIVEQILISNGPPRSSSVISGPFPLGKDIADPVGYAYNRAIAPRPYDPRLASTLAGVAARVARSGKDDAGDVRLAALTLVHPSQPIPKACCQLMSEQLAAVGIAVKLAEYSPEQLTAKKVDFDLRYAELAMWEPVVDARRLLGPRGELSRCSARMALALADVDRALNWQDVRQRLAEVHRIAQDELIVLPLWQTTNYFAYRRSIQGISSRPVTLYQGIDAWDLSGDWEGAP
jgi:ABC-type transport system substrate-binding protein